MNIATQKSTADVLSEIAAKLGTTAEYMWPKYVQYVHDSSVTGVIGGSVLALIAIVVIVVCVLLIRHDGDWEFPASMVIVFSLIGLVVSICMVGRSIPQMMNPEAAALERVVEKVK